MGKTLHSIQVYIKDNFADVAGAHVASAIKKYSDIESGKVKSGKIYLVTYPLEETQLRFFAENGIQDTIINDILINTSYESSFYKSYVIVAKLPGVTDDEGISSQKTLFDILNISFDISTQHIFSQDIFFFENELTIQQLQYISENFLGNKLIHHFQYGSYNGVLSYYVPEVKIQASNEIALVNLDGTDAELKQLSAEKHLSLNLEEMKAIQNYFKRQEIREKRLKKGSTVLPTDCELEIIAQTWSEHCKHKEFNAEISFTDNERGTQRTIDSLFKTYIRNATEEVKQKLEANGNDWLIKVFTDNAGVVKASDNELLAWKVETHNSPSAIDPYGGAITGILGNNRDPMGTGIGGAKLLFNTNVLCFGSPAYDKPLLTGQLHPRRIFEGVRKGIEDGGNKSGIPTVNGAIIFDDRYAGKPLVYCGTGGIMPMQYKGRDTWTKEIGYGDFIVTVGGRVGKDGIHGATFSSRELDESSPQSAVQIGSPITQKLAGDFLEIVCNEGLVSCSTDCGAGGLSSAIGELASISNGAIVHLEKVPLKYSGLRPWEIFLSESQERMVLVVKKEDIDTLLSYAELMEVEAVIIGNFTNDGYLDVRFEEKIAAYLELGFMHDGVPRKYLEAEWTKPDTQESTFPAGVNYNYVLTRLLGSLNICSRENVIRQYDHEVKGKTIVKPLMGNLRQAPQDAAVMRLNFNSYEGIAVSNGIIPKLADLDPYQMSANAFDEGIRQIISIGGKLPNITPADNIFWSVNDNFCVPDSVYHLVNNPDGKLKLGQLVLMCEALYDMSTYFAIPMTSGKDSMKNDFKGDGVKISVPPTLLYSMTAKIEDVRKTITSDFKQPGDLIYLIGKTYDELAGSEFHALLNVQGSSVPQVRMDEAKQAYLKMMQANESGLINSSHDISDGGAMVSIVECCFGNNYGARITIRACSKMPISSFLFSESPSRFIVSIAPYRKTEFELLMQDTALLLGEVTASETVLVSEMDTTIIDLPVAQLHQAWKIGLDFSGTKAAGV